MTRSVPRRLSSQSRSTSIWYRAPEAASITTVGGLVPQRSAPVRCRSAADSPGPVPLALTAALFAVVLAGPG